MWQLLAAIILAAAEAGGAGGEDLQSQVDHWVRQLTAPELSQRADAEQQLIALGPKILDLLPTFKDGGPAGDAQKRDTIARIRQRLENELAQRSTQATTITLHAAGKPLSEVLAELTHQSGNKMEDLRRQMGQEPTDPKITVDFDKTPFWQALDKTLDQANLTVYHFHANNDELGIIARGPKELPRSGRACYTGPLRIDATRLAAERDLHAAGNVSSLKLTLEIAWEPRMRPIILQQSLAELHVTDDRGQPIRVDGIEGQLERPVDPAGTAAEFLIPLVSPPRSAERIASLKGKLRTTLPGKTESFEFSDLKSTKPIELRKARATVTLDQVRKNNDAWEVRMLVHFDRAGSSLESFRTWIFNNEAYLVGEDKKPIHHSGFQTTRQTEDEVGVAYLFDLPNGLDGMTFVYRTPAILNSVPLDYELKDLKLP
jgi:hypothetical protein